MSRITRNPESIVLHDYMYPATSVIILSRHQYTEVVLERLLRIESAWAPVSERHSCNIPEPIPALVCKTCGREVPVTFMGECLSCNDFGKHNEVTQ